MTDWKKLEDEVDKAITKDYLINFNSKTINECKYIQKVAEDRLYHLRYNRCSRVILDAEKRILSQGNIEPTPPQETTNTPMQVQENPHVCDYNIDSLFVDFGWVGKKWKEIFRDPNDRGIDKRLEANNFSEKLRKCSDKNKLIKLRKLVEFHYDHKKETISIGVLVIGISVAFIIEGVPFIIPLIRYVSSFINGVTSSLDWYKGIWLIAGFIVSYIGYKIFRISYQNFQTCHILFSRIDERITELENNHDVR